MQLGFLSGAFTAAAAVWIAYKVYPLQKEKDRALQVLQEEAVLIKEFFEVTERYLYSLKQAYYTKTWTEDADAEYGRVRAAYDILSIYASKETIRVCRDYTVALFQYRHSLKFELTKDRETDPHRIPYPYKNLTSRVAVKEVDDALREALVVARVKILACSDAEAREALLP